ncbi:MAG: ABC transporter permease, partial [Anaeroplasmataceae bacterium]|nr:ABC transporter permease [Anaeroplasmataceae bacterium]
IEGYSSIDYKIERDFTELTARVVTASFSSKLHPIELIQGRLPENDKECVVHNMGVFLDEIPLEEEIVVEDTTYTIVGICNSPVYYYRMQETTQIGNGNLDVILYLDDSYVSNSTITDISITVKGAKEYNSFKASYFEYIAPVEEKLKDISEVYIQKRLMELIPMGGLENPSSSLNPSEIQWYILNRKSNLSYVSFEVNSTKVNNVAVVFPFFFFFIAALIALTSVTRLIHEDRSSIGTLKSLGYSNLRILNKYFIYAAFACIVCSVCGLLLGVYGLPMVIYACYNSLFLMPKGIFGWHAWSVILSSVSMSAIVFIVMIAVCLSTLKEKPNALLVPKAPKAGRRILLERIGFIWKRLKFKYKSSIRNIFRFKKNLIMMIVGVGGCTGVMLVGLSLKDTLGAPAKDQFDTVLNYDFSLGIQEKVTLDFLQDSSYMYLYKEEGKVKKNLDYEVNILYADDTLLDFMKLDVKSLPEDSVIISSQLAQQFHLRKGSNLIIDVNGKEQSFKVNSIFTNYVENYIITKKQDERFNQMLVRLGEEDSKQYDSIVKEMYQSKDLLSVTDLTQTRKLYTSLSNG